ncbi:DUF2341 domain-containing protein, partial [archaeon]|nr:DUF2341 domain-containing protein [archaeon]
GVSSGGLADGLAGWWHFDNDVLDETTNDNDGVLGSTSYNSSGKFSQALQFDGDDYVTVPDDATLDMTDAITLSAWVNPSTSSSPYAEWAYKKPVYIQDTRDSWWNKSWTNRKLFHLNSSADGELTDYQVKKTIAFPTAMQQASFEDMRFTTTNGTLIDYWIESHTDSNTADVWLEIPTLPASGGLDIWMYYGHPTAMDASDGDATFIQYHGTASATFYDSTIVPQPFVYETHGRTTAEDYEIKWGVTENNFASPRDAAYVHVTDITKIPGYYDGVSGSSTSLPPGLAVDQWYNMKIIASSTHVDFYVDDTSLSSGFDTSGLANNMGLFMKINIGTGEQDWSFIRKYTANEPTWAADGAEDTYLTDYQIKIDNINTSELYTEGKIQQYCNDTRFTWLNQTSGTEQAIDFWTENCFTTNGANSTFWVEVPEIYAGLSNNTVYVYYGNPYASTTSNGTNTFEFFDDFLGSSVDTNKWTVTGAISVSDSIATFSGTSKVIVSKTTFGTNYAMRIRSTFGHIGSSSYTEEISFYSGGYVSVFGSYFANPSGIAGKYTTYVDSSWELTSIGSTLIAGQYDNIDMIRNGSTNVIFKVDDTTVATHTSIVPVTSGAIRIKSDHASGSRTYSDWVFVRKYTSTEPTVLSVGAEITNGISKGNAYAINANVTHAIARINNKIITAPISAGWNHIALTYDKDAGSSQIKLYINSGIPTTADYSTAITTNANDVLIGNSFVGTIDEVRIYNKTLTSTEITNTYNTAILNTITTNPRASFNGNPTVNYTGTLSNGETTTIEVASGNFTIGENNITIYIDAGVVDYTISMLGLSALVSNTGMNNVTVKQVVAFKTDGSNCVFPDSNNTIDVGDVFSVSGCPMSCDEFLSIKAYTDCTGVFGEFSRRPSGC